MKVKVGQWRSFGGSIYQVIAIEAIGPSPVLTRWVGGSGNVHFNRLSIEDDPVLTPAEVNDYILNRESGG